MPLTDDQRAILYRDQWDARIAYRANQLRALMPDREALARLWADYRPIYDPSNYIDGQPEEDFMSPYDVSDDPGISASTVRAPSHIKRSTSSERVV